MNNCFKCHRPIPAGQEMWMRRKSTNTNVSFCSQCAQEVRQALKAKQTEQPARPAPLPKATTAPPPYQPPAAPDAADASAKPSVTMPLDSVLILILVTLVGAPLLGGIVAFVGYHLMYLIIAFPAFMGFAGGFMMSQGIKWGKMRDPVVAAAFGLVLGLFIYGSYRYIAYLILKNDVRTELIKAIEAEYGESDAAFADEIFDLYLREETGRTGFTGVLLLEAKEGVSIARGSSSFDGGGINIGTELTWVYWLGEIIAVAGLSAFLASGAASQPFCEYHDRWYAKEKSLGGVKRTQAENVMDLLYMGDYVSFGRELHQKTPIPGMEFFYERCVGCQESNPILTVKRVTRSSKGKTDYSVVEKQTLAPSEGEQIVEGVIARG